MAGRLPKVTEYIKNMGKSVAYATIDAVKEPTETVSDFLETNDDLFKTIYSATKNYKETLKTVDRSIKNSKLYDAMNVGIKNLKEDLRTGQFYNKAREEQQGMAGMFGDDFADFSEFETDDVNFNFSDDMFADEDTPSKPTVSPEIKAMAQTSSGLGNIIASTSKAQSSVIVSATGVMVESNKASTRLLSAQNEKINASIVSGFAGVNAGMNMVASIMSGPMTQFMNESTKFYGDVSSKLSEISAYLKETTEMQRNLYKSQEQQWKSSKYEDIVSSTGAPDLMSYAKNIYKNIMNLDPSGGMFTGGGDENMFKMFVGSPLKAIPQMMAKLIIPTAVTKVLDEFDKNLSGLFPTLIARLNKMSEESSGDLDPRGIIGSLLGIKISKKTTVDTSKYTRGPIPFDGETKKAIVDVIPAYLARIEAAVSGTPERIFDGKSGKFKTLRQVHEEFRNIETRGANEAVSSIRDDYEKWARRRAYSHGIDDKKRDELYKEYMKKLTELGRQIYRDGGDFNPYRGFGPKGERKDEINPYMSIFDEDELKDLMRTLKSTSKGKRGVYQISGNTMEAIIRATRELEGNEGGFANQYTHLFNDGIFMLDDHGRIKAFRGSENRSREYNRNKVSDSGPNRFKFMNTNDYLKDILAEVRYMRMHWGNRGKGKRGSGPSGGPSDFDSYYKANFESDMETPYQKETSYTWDKPKKEQTEAERLGITEENLKKTAVGQEVTSKWERAKKAVDKFLKSPTEWAVRVIKKADERIFDVMFGDENGETFRDKHGLEYRSFLDYLVTRAEDMFDKLAERVKSTWTKMYDKFKQTKVGEWVDGKVQWVKEHGKQFAQSVGGKLKDKFGWAGGTFRDSWNNTYGSLINRLRNGEVIDEEDLSVFNPPAAPTKVNPAVPSGLRTLQNMTRPKAPTKIAKVVRSKVKKSDIDHKAYGGLVTKYGLTMLSPGEIVIPNPDESTRRMNLSEEKKSKSRIMSLLRGGKIAHHAEGTTDTKQESKIWDVIKKITAEVGGDGAADMVASGLIGGGVSLITGMIGGPLLGAAAGAGVGLIKNSETARHWLFGQEMKDGTYKEGVIPKKTLEKFTSFFNKNGKSMIDFGIAGGLAGLFTPFGLVGGALAGATLGYAKNTDFFKELMFGDAEKGKTGLMSEETKKKLEKAFPAMAIGAGAGVLLGPFGLLGNAMLGAGAGYIATSDKFKEFIFGKEGEDGKKQGGIAGAIKKGVLEPLGDFATKTAHDLKDYAKKWIIEPTKEFMEGAGNFVKNIFISIGDRVADGLNGIFAKHFGRSFSEFIRENIFKRVTSTLTTIAKVPIGIAKATIGLPFAALGQIGTGLKMSQIARGTLTTRNAQERLDLRDKNWVRAGKHKLLGQDKTIEMDRNLAAMGVGELSSLKGNLTAFMNARGEKNKAYNAHMADIGGKVTALFDANSTWAKRGHGLLPKTAYGDKSKILKALYKGDVAAATKQLKKAGMNDDDIQSFLNSIDLEGMEKARGEMAEELGMDRDKLAEMEEKLGFEGLAERSQKGNRYLKRARRLIDTELKYKEAIEAGKTPEEKAKEAEQKKQEEHLTTQEKQGSTMIGLISRLVNRFCGDTIDIETGEAKSGTGNNSNASNSSDNENSSNSSDNGNTKSTGMDSIEDATEHMNKKKKGKFRESIVNAFTGINEKLGNLFGDKKEEKETPNIVQKIFGAVGGVGTKLKSIISGIGGSKVGLVAAAIGGASLIGYGSEFVKKHLMPALEKSKMFQWIKEKVETFWGSVTDGSLFTKMAGKLSQGLSYALKNIVGPLTEAIIVSLPSMVAGIASGVWNGIKALWNDRKSKKKTAFSNTTDKNLSADLKKVAASMPVGADEKAIAQEFSGSSWSVTTNAVIPGYKDDSSGGINSWSDDAKSVFNRSRASNGLKFNGTSANNTTSVDNGDGTVTLYDANQNELGTYDTATGEIVRGAGIVTEKTGIRGAIGKSFVRSLAGGKNIASAITKLGRKGLTSNKSIFKSAKKIITGGINPFGVFGRIGGAIGTTVKGAVRAGTESIGAASTLGAGLRNTAITGGKNIVNKMTDLALNIGDKITTGVSKSKIVGAITDNSKAAAKVADGALSIAQKFTNFGEKLVNSSLFSKLSGFISKYVKPIGEDKIKNCIKKLFGELGEKIVQKAGSGLAKIGLKVAAGLSPLAIYTWGKAFYDGFWGKTETILGVTKDSGLEINCAMRFVIGLLNAINENLLLGLVPMEWLMDIIIGVFGKILGVTKEEYEAAQAASDAIFAQVSMEEGREVSAGEYNNQQGLLKKLANAFTGKETVNYKDYKNTSNNKSSTSGTGRSFAAGKGRGGQQGGRFANMRYGNSTIGEAGCAPVSAANMLGSSIPEAATFAQRTGHVAPDGSTDIGYFNDYFSAKGIANRTTTNKRDVDSALKHGRSAVMLGRDPGGGDESAYSNNSHFITARGTSGGNVIVNDPALGVRKMPRSKVMRNMKASVLTGRGRFVPTEDSYKRRQTNVDKRIQNANKVIETARGERGYKEKGGNNNKYGIEYGLNYQPWCCIFVWWVFKHAGASSLFYGGHQCASCTELLNWYKARGQVVQSIQPGDIIIFTFNNGGKPQHVGIATTAAEGGRFMSIEGNTSSDSTGSQDNGEGVYEKRRSVKNVVGVIRPAYGDATFDDAIPADQNYNYETGESSSITSSGGLFDKLAGLGKVMLKAVFGEGLYNAVFGDDGDSSTGSGTGSEEDMTSDGANDPPVDPNVNEDGTLSGANIEEKIWRYLRSKGYSKAGTAGIMGNLYKESGLRPNNLQNTYEKKLGNDADYTTRVNSGTYGKEKFMKDGGGYGLAQWTYSSRKGSLYDATIKKGLPINNTKSQLDLLDKELDSYGLVGGFKNATSVNEASDTFMRGFEKPAVENTAERRDAAKSYFDKYSGIGRGYASRINNKYVNDYSGRARDDSANRSTLGGGVSYTTFLETIVQILLSIADNTDTLNKILEILSKNFNINVDSADVTQAAKKKNQAKQALRDMMANKSDAEDLSNMLQSKNTDYLVKVMTNIARE